MTDITATIENRTFDVKLADYTINVTVISGAGTAGTDNNLKTQSVSGTIDGSNTAFTIATSFSGKSFIIVGQTFLIEDVHYTISGTDIVMNDAPPAGLSGFTPYLYHG